MIIKLKSFALLCFVQVISLTLIVTSCNKTDKDQINSVISLDNNIDLVKNWLIKQKQNAQITEKQQITYVENNLMLDQINISQIQNNETLIIVPLSVSFLSRNSDNKSYVSSLVLKKLQNGEIKSGYIVQLIPHYRADTNS